MVDENGPHYFVIQNPGPKWIARVPYNQQPEFPKHFQYVSRLHDAGQVVLSGPFMKTAGGLAGELADGGMTIFKAAASLSEHPRCHPQLLLANFWHCDAVEAVIAITLV